MKRYHYITLCFISLFLVIGSVGALETGNIGFGQAIVQIVLFFALAYLFKKLGDKKAPRETAISAEHKQKYPSTL